MAFSTPKQRETTIYKAMFRCIMHPDPCCVQEERLASKQFRKRAGALKGYANSTLTLPVFQLAFHVWVGKRGAQVRSTKVALSTATRNSLQRVRGSESSFRYFVKLGGYTNSKFPALYPDLYKVIRISCPHMWAVEFLLDVIQGTMTRV